MFYRLPAIVLAVSLLYCFSSSSLAQHDAAQHDANVLGERTRDGHLAPMLKNLGAYHRSIRTNSEIAQKFFDQGLILIYGFNHAEALRSFKEVVRLDPDCAMGFWGQALALSPNINNPLIGQDHEQQGYQAAQEALRRKDGAGTIESGLISAMALRFSADSKPDRGKLNAAYADAMKGLYSRFEGDPDVASLYADAVLNTMPWDYWTKAGAPRTGIPEAIAALEKAIRSYPDHPGAHHFYIHAVEASNDPDRAIPSADKLRDLVPGAGHLVHMPSHIYIRVGRYSDATVANLKAIEADENYVTQCRAQGIYPAAYYPHNIHFLFATLAMEGRGKETLEAAQKVSGVHGPEHIQQPGFGFPHLLRTMPLFGLIRFAKWDDIMKAQDPGTGQPFGQVIYHLARGLAMLRNPETTGSSGELELLRTASKNPDLPQLKIFDQNDLATLSSIAENLLAAEIASKQDNVASAVALARKAVDIEDNLRYSEPPDWPIPARHFLGAILIRAGKPKEAEMVYREDLNRHRNNGWSLCGLMNSLKAQGRDQEAFEAERKFRQAWVQADFAITSSRM